MRTPWNVDYECNSRFWWIKNELTGKRVKIGPVQLKGICYFDRAVAEAERRNECISKDLPIGLHNESNRITRKILLLERTARCRVLRINGKAGERVNAFLMDCRQKDIDLSPWSKRIAALKNLVSMA